MAELAEELGLERSTITREVKRAENLGLVPEIREKMLGTLDAAANVHADILNPLTTPEMLQKHDRGYKLKLAAANSVLDGLGVFKKATEKTVTNTLEMIAAEQAPAEGKWGEDAQGNRLRPRIAFQPETVDADVIDPGE